MFKNIITAINKHIQTLDESQEEQIIEILNDFDDNEERAEAISEFLGVNFNCIFDLL